MFSPKRTISLKHVKEVIMTRRWSTILAVLITLSLMAWTLAEDYEEEAETAADNGAVTQLETAIAHANNSLNTGEFEGAHRHLGHVLNCIEGEGGENFNPDWGNPCAGQGVGIINDIAGHPAEEEMRLLVEAANGLALAGVNTDSLETVHSAAAGVRALLELVLPSLQS
jgi:hypothetical protein